ncbi:Hypothetical predicted protein, partial [Paramuricea clavata]
MKSWTIFALLIAVFAGFFGIGHTEELDDFEEKAFEVVDSNTEHENALEFEDAKIPSNDEDEAAMFKRAPWRRRRWRLRRKLRRVRRKIRSRRVWDVICTIVGYTREGGYTI